MKFDECGSLKIHGRLRVVLVRGLLLLSIIIGGCKTPDEYKEQADDEVYDIINRKWTDDIAGKYNYKVSDAEHDPNDVEIAAYEDVAGMVTLSKAVSIATANNRRYQTQKENLYRSALSLTLVRHSFAYRWFGTIDADYANFDGDESVSAEGGLGFRKFFDDGTTLTTSIAADWLSFLTGNADTTLGSVLSATISKPLLRGAGKEIVLEELTQAERDVLYEIRTFNRYRKEFVILVIDNYYSVLQNLDSVDNAENNYRNLVESYDRAKMMADSGRLPPFQADQTKQNMLRAEDNLTRTQRIYQQSLDNFKLFLGIDIDSDITLDSNELAVLIDQGIDIPDYSIEKAVEAAKLFRLDLANGADRLEDSVRKIKVAENKLLADVSVVGGASLGSSDDNEALRYNLDGGNYNLGLRIDLPLDRLAERNAFRRTLLNYQQQLRDYEELVDNVELSVIDANRRLIEAAKRFDIQQLSLRLAQDRVESTDMLVRAGRAASRDLLDAQDSLLSAQNERTSAMVDYTMNKLEFLRDIGLLLVQPDGMWDEKIIE
jgi:outer membrane protein TolC